MLLCPISPHLAHPRSLHCGALSQAASSFWSQQQCYSINPLAGYTTAYKWCCFLSLQAPELPFCPAAHDAARDPKHLLRLRSPAHHGWASTQFATWKVQPKYLFSGACVRRSCTSDFPKLHIPKKKKAKPFAETKGLSPPLLGGCESSVFNKVIPDL